ncbi:hypothetical protein VTL71DRAFT_14896 [Oculimacula yallundae]|uniref:Uncharacterized protein n=1 Tax=Oculimacula yallundae TaxID=86028 RepID=A0ABR4CF28_9HELO
MSPTSGKIYSERRLKHSEAPSSPRPSRLPLSISTLQSTSYLHIHDNTFAIIKRSELKRIVSMAPRRESKEEARIVRPCNTWKEKDGERWIASKYLFTQNLDQFSAHNLTIATLATLSTSYPSVRRSFSPRSSPRAISPRATTKNTKPVICKRGIERTAIRSERLQMELCDRLGDLALGGRLMGVLWKEGEFTNQRKVKDNSRVVKEQRDGEMMDLDEGEKVDVEGDVAME